MILGKKGLVNRRIKFNKFNKYIVLPQNGLWSKLYSPIKKF